MRLPDLDFKDVELVVALADTGRLVQAASHLGLSVSALSHRLSALESRVGVRLFLRSPEGMVVTAEGAVFVQHARDALRAMEAAWLATHTQKTVARLGSAWLMSTTLLPSLLAIAHRRHPHLEWEVSTGRSGDVLDWVERGRVEVGLMRAQASRPGLRMVALGEDPVSLVVPEGHPWVVETPALETWSGAQVIRVAPHTGFGRFVDQLLRERGIQLSTPVTVDHLETALAMVEAGVGPALLPRSLVALRAPRGVAVVPIPAAGLPERSLALAVRAGKPLPSWAQDWPALIQHWLAEDFARGSRPPND